jgi:hypothetical protein
LFIPKIAKSRNPFVARVLNAVDDEDETMATMRIAIADAVNQQPATATAKPRAQAPADQAAAQVGAKPAEFTDLYHQYFPKVFATYGRVRTRKSPRYRFRRVREGFIK